MRNEKNEINYDIMNSIATLSTSPKGWTTELNRISWNGGEPKFDIRDWAPNKSKVGKGVVLTHDEFESLIVAGCEYLFGFNALEVYEDFNDPRLTTIIAGGEPEPEEEEPKEEEPEGEPEEEEQEDEEEEAEPPASSPVKQAEPAPTSMAQKMAALFE